MTLVALGFDVGPTRTGAARISVDDMGHVTVEWAAHAENGGADLAAQMIDVARVGGIAVFETTHGHAYDARRVQQLLETTRAEGVLAERWRSIPGASAPVMLTNREIRGALLRSETGSDAQVKIAVEGLCRRVPELKAVARPHAYDAIAAAIVGFARHHKRAIALPPHIDAEIHAQREREKAARAARKAQGLPAVEPVKRRPTRAQSERRSAAAKAGWARRAHQ